MAYYIKIFKFYHPEDFVRFNTVAQKLAHYIKIFED